MSHTFTEEYRRSDEYKTLSACVLAVAPTLPQILVEQAIFMHKKDPQLYKKWRNIEKEYEKTVEKKEETVKNCFPSKDSTHASDEHDPPPSPRSE
jgi:hypothetical protein